MKVVFKYTASMVELSCVRRLAVPFTIAVAVLGAGCGSAQPAKTAGPATTDAAPAPAPDARSFGVLLMAHGGGPQWDEAILETVKPLESKHTLEVAFGMADAATLKQGVQKLEARGVKRVGVVRLFVSGESFTRETEQILGLTDGAPPEGTTPAGGPHAHHAAHGAGACAGHSMAFFRVPSRASYALSVEGLADAPGMGNVLADRAAALSKEPAKEDVLILAHGPGDDDENARWLAKIDARAAAVRARAPFRRVQVETLREDWPDKRAEAEKRIRAFVQRSVSEGGKAIVIPFRVFGFGPYKQVLEGLDYVADGRGLIPHPEVTSWIDGQITTLGRAAFRAPIASSP